MFTRVLLCAICALGASAPSALAAFPGQNGKIAYESFRDGDVDIWTMRPTGREQVNLTHDPSAIDIAPKWSPDGGRIVFASTRATAADPSPGDFEIFVMNADGSDPRQLTFNAADDVDPAWSPDGRQLVFARFFGDFDADLFTIGADGSGERAVTESPGVMDRQPVWSPNGREIAFSRGGNAAEERGDIFTIRPDGTHLRALTSTAADEESPDWSPDGHRIAFTSDRDARDTQWDVYVIGRGGGRADRVTYAGCGGPAWSPDGRNVACPSDRTGDPEIWTMRADGSQPHNRTQSPSSADVSPDWQPLPAWDHAHDDD